MMQTLAIGMPGVWEWAIIMIVGLLIFGRRLPEVGRNLGKSIVEFRKGIKGIEDEVHSASGKPAPLETPKPAPPLEQPAQQAQTVGDAAEKTVPQSGSPDPAAG